MAKQKLPIRTMRIRFRSLRADDDNVSEQWVNGFGNGLYDIVRGTMTSDCIETEKRNCANQMHQMIILLFLII